MNKCMCCYKEIEDNNIVCPECKEKLDKYGFIEVMCPECWQTFYKPIKANKTVCCPDCRKVIKQIKATERKRKQREREKMSR